MTKLERWGGFGAFTAAASFVVGLVMFATVLMDFTSASDPADAVAFLVDNRLALYIWNLVITIVFGIALVPLALALRDRLGADAPSAARVSAVFGLIWAGLIIATGMIINVGYGTVADLQATDPDMAATVWSAVDSVANGLGGGNEIVGGVWVLVVSLAGMHSGLFGRLLGYLGVASGVAGLITVVPGLEPVGAVFGIGLIAWFVGVGRVLLRASAAPRGVEVATAGVDTRP